MATARRFLVAFAVLLFAGGFLAPVASSQTASPVPDDGELRLMTYNIKHARGNDDCVNPTVPEGTVPEAECEIDLPRVADVIEQSGASIVGLQEVDRFWARSGGVDQPAELAELLGMDSCYGANLDHEPDDHASVQHQYGVAILSDYPIVDCTNTHLPTPDGWEQRGALSATIELDGGGQVLVINTHLQANREGAEEEAKRQRTEQFAAVMDIANQSTLPTVIMGDLNSNPGEGELAPIEDPASGFSDVWTAVHGDADGFTRPAGPDVEPEVRIDYIFVSDEFDVVDSEVMINELTRIAADHFPVIADVRTGITSATPVATPVM